MNDSAASYFAAIKARRLLGLLQWAKNARRRSNEATQRDLFGRAA